MSNFGVIQQGRFTGTGNAVRLNLRSDVDRLTIYNFTIADADQTTAIGVQFYWQRGFPNDRVWMYKKSNAAGAANLSDILASGGVKLIETKNTLGTLQNSTTGTAISAISTAAIPVATNAGVNALVAGDVVRLYSVVGAPQLGGFDFTVGHNTLGNTTFSLDYMSQLAVAGTTADWRKINFDPNFYPRHRYITTVTSSGTSAVIETSVAHGYKVGQIVYFTVPTSYGMRELNTLEGTITAVTNQADDSTNTFTVDIDISSFTTFAWPAAATFPFTPAIVNVKGQDSPYAYANSLDPLADSTENLGYIGVELGGGSNKPGGATSDVMYWVAEKAFSVDNL